MILIDRGAEPQKLADIRNRDLPIIRAFGTPSGDQIPKTYKVVAKFLWEKQHNKCCYCEKIVQRSYNDVEHYRPKGRANRNPGCAKDHGYWWLAFTWENLIFACSSCNRSEKNDEFPLDLGSVSLSAEEAVPGKEIPLLLDPAAFVNPVEHIEFVFESLVHNSKKHWWANPRGNSSIGSHTIRVCGLNRSELRELRTTYVNNYVQPQIDRLRQEIYAGDIVRAKYELRRALEMMSPRFEFAALTYDAFCAEFKSIDLFGLLGLKIPDPVDACK